MNPLFERYRGLSDEELVSRIINDDRDAAAYLLIEKCGKQLKYLAGCKFATLNIQFQELVSEMYLYLKEDNWKKLGDFRNECQLKNYISLLAARWLHKKMDRAVTEKTVVVSLDNVSGRELQTESGERQVLVRQLIENIRSLSDPRARTAIVECVLKGASVDEVAAILGTTPGNVYTIVSRTINRLRCQMEGGAAHG